MNRKQKSTQASRSPNAPSFGTRHSALGISLPGFTFIEVLFAVIILGVGMIMIAGMLPVAIKQNADSRNDLTAKAVAESGYAYLRTMIQTHPEAFPETCGKRNQPPNADPFQPKNSSALDKYLGDELMGLNSNNDYTAGTPANLPPTYRKAGRVVPLTYDVVTHNSDLTYRLTTLQANHAYNNRVPKPALLLSPETDNYPLAWHQGMLADRISSVDARYQWTAFYRRDEGSNVIHLTIVAQRLQQTDVVPAYSVGATMSLEAINNTNGPYLVPIQVEDGLLDPDKIKFVDNASGAIDRTVADTGSFLIVAFSPPLNGNPDITTPAGDLDRPFRNNGHVFRLGARREDLDSTANNSRVWELQPGYDLPSADAGPDGVRGTPDDTPDGSMNVLSQFDQTGRPSTMLQLVNSHRVVDKTTPHYVPGTTAWAWLIGRGRNDPSSSSDATFVGPTQDLSVMSVDVTLP